MTVCSTSFISRADIAGERASYLYNDVWYGHEVEDDFPRVAHSQYLGTVRDVFCPDGGAEVPGSFMALLVSGGVAAWSFAWTGYHLDAAEVCSVDSAYCPIDVYVQLADFDWRIQHRDEFAHYVAVDILAPCMAHTTAPGRQAMMYQGQSICQGYFV